MRHQVAGRKFGRRKMRQALFRGLISSLILSGKIETTEAKAKAISPLVDKLVAKAKKKTLQTRRLIEAFLQNKVAVNKLVDEIGPKFAGRESGFTSIIRIGTRRGDGAMIVKLELLEKAEAKKKEEKEAAPASPTKEAKPIRKKRTITKSRKETAK